MTFFLLRFEPFSKGGVYLFTLMEWHTASWAILLIGFAEVVVLSWVYGIERTLTNIREMGIKINRVSKMYWKCVLVVVTPVSCIAVFIFLLTDIGTTSFRNYEFPPWADAMGWMFGLATLLPLVVIGIIEMIKHRNNVKSLLIPTPQWISQEFNK